jgi:hypothetical protein
MDSQGSGGMRTHFPSERKWALGLQVYLSSHVFLFLIPAFDKYMHIGTSALNFGNYKALTGFLLPDLFVL